MKTLKQKFPKLYVSSAPTEKERARREKEMLVTTTIEPVQMITIERVRESDGTIAWSWDAFGEEEKLFGGVSSSLSDCLDSMRSYLRDEGIAP